MSSFPKFPNTIFVRSWTYKNHFKCGHVLQDSSEPLIQNTFYSQIGTPEAEVMSPLEEAIRAAMLIHAEATSVGQKVTLCLSGGADSEAMLRAFIAAKVSFECIFMRFENDLNLYDIQENVALCAMLNVPFRFFDMQICDFFESGKYFYYGEKYRCQSPQLAAHLYLLDHVQGFPVLASNPLEVHARDKVLNYNLPGDKHCVYLRYFVENNRAGAPYFFLYTPEICYAFLHTEIMQEIIYFGLKGANFNYGYEMKCLTYQQAGLDVTPRRDKYTGFEKVREHYDKLDQKQYGYAFDQRFRRPLEKLNPLPESHLQILDNRFIFNEPVFEKIKSNDEMNLAYASATSALPSATSDTNITGRFRKRLVQIFSSDADGLLIEQKSLKMPEKMNMTADAWAYTQTESKLWLCRELESLAKDYFKKPVSIWILASWYGQLSFLLLARERLEIKNIVNIDIDQQVIADSKHLHNHWIVTKKINFLAQDVNQIDYKENTPDIVINTAFEHFERLEWFLRIPSNCWFIIQANNLKMHDHPNCFRSLNEFKQVIQETNSCEIYFAQAKYFFEDSPFQRFMIIGKKI